MEYKTVPFEAKMMDSGEISGYAAAFQNLDDGGDIIMPGAFAKTLSERIGRVKLCWQHDWKAPIGRIIEAHEDERGLFIKASISDTTLGRDVRTLLKDGVVSELSIGYDAIKAEPQMLNGRPVRILKELRLYEVSPVTVAMNAAAVITDVKAGDPTAGDEERDALADGLALLLGTLDMPDTKAGRVLSASNRSLVERAIEALQALLAAAEPPMTPASDDVGKALTAQADEQQRLMLRLKLLEVL